MIDLNLSQNVLHCIEGCFDLEFKSISYSHLGNPCSHACFWVMFLLQAVRRMTIAIKDIFLFWESKDSYLILCIGIAVNFVFIFEASRITA